MSNNLVNPNLQVQVVSTFRYPSRMRSTVRLNVEHQCRGRDVAPVVEPMRSICIFDKGLACRVNDFTVRGAFRPSAAFHEHDTGNAFVSVPRDLAAGLDGDAPCQKNTPFEPQLPFHRLSWDDRKLLDLQTGVFGREMPTRLGKRG